MVLLAIPTDAGEPLGGSFCLLGMVGIFLQGSPNLRPRQATTPHLAKDFMRDIPGCPSYRIHIIASLPALDTTTWFTTTRLPMRRQSSCTLSSWLFILYWEVSVPFGTSFQSPWLTASLTLEMSGSLSIQFCKEATDAALLSWSRVCSIRTVSPGVGTSSSGPLNGSLLRASAFACSFPALKTIL